MSNQDTVKDMVKTASVDEVQVKINFNMTGFIPSVVAQHLTLQRTPGNIVLSFYETNQPIMINPTPEQVEALKKQGITAECVARVSVPVIQFPSFAKVIADLAEQLKAEQSEREVAQDGEPKPDNK
jgi:hypothetical protein